MSHSRIYQVQVAFVSGYNSSYVTETSLLVSRPQHNNQAFLLVACVFESENCRHTTPCIRCIARFDTMVALLKQCVAIGPL